MRWITSDGYQHEDQPDLLPQRQLRHSYVTRPSRLPQDRMAKTTPRRVTPNYEDLGKLALRDEIKKLTTHKDPVIRLLATFALKTDT